MTKWQVQEAKSRLSEVMERAESEGPQTITKHGKAKAVLLSIAAYEALAAGRPNFIDYLLSGPRFDDFEIERDKSLPRDVDL